MRWMKVDEARAYAGGVSRRTLYDAVARGTLAAARVGTGRNMLFCEAWLDQWLTASARVDAGTVTFDVAGRTRASAAGEARRG